MHLSFWLKKKILPCHSSHQLTQDQENRAFLNLWLTLYTYSTDHANIMNPKYSVSPENDTFDTYYSRTHWTIHKASFDTKQIVLVDYFLYNQRLNLLDNCNFSHFRSKMKQKSISQGTLNKWFVVNNKSN